MQTLEHLPLGREQQNCCAFPALILTHSTSKQLVVSYVNKVTIGFKANSLSWGSVVSIPHSSLDILRYLWGVVWTDAEQEHFT